MSDLSSFLFSLKGKKILGVNPPVHDFAFFDLWAKPLGLLHILGRLRDLGNEVFLVDCIHEARDNPKTFGRWTPQKQEIPKPEAYRNIPRRYWHFGLDKEELLARIRTIPRPDLVLVTSSMTYWYPGVFWCIEVIREALPSVPVFLGEHIPFCALNIPAYRTPTWSRQFRCLFRPRCRQWIFMEDFPTE